LAQLQDARIRSARFDEAAGVVTIDVTLPDARPLTVLFEGVRPSPHIEPMLKLGGTILGWKPSAGPGNTHIYLMDGVITLRADRVVLK
jgi:hypothetical protein